MKIDLIIGSLRSGGAERVVSTLANHFVDTGHEVRLITFKDGDKYHLDNRIIRKKFHKNLPIFNFALFRALIYLFIFYWRKKNRPEIISAHIGLMGLPTIPIAKIYNLKIIVSEHINHLSTDLNLEKKILWNILYKYADAITILTKFDLAFFKEKNNNVHIIHNPNSFIPAKFIKINKEKNILAIGSLDRYQHKGFDNLLDIALEIKNVSPDWKFQIVGEGDVGRKFLEKKINKLKLNDTVFLLGYRSDVEELLRNSSIFILCSRFEGLPMALMEAASQGTACIAYDCISGPSDVIENGISGILVKDQDKKEMIQQLKHLINNKKFRKDLGVNSLSESAKFSIKKIGAQWESLFKSLLE